MAINLFDPYRYVRRLPHIPRPPLDRRWYPLSEGCTVEWRVNFRLFKLGGKTKGHRF